MWKMNGSCCLRMFFLFLVINPYAHGQSEPAKSPAIIGYGVVGDGAITANVKGGSNSGISGGGDFRLANRFGFGLEGGSLYGVVYEGTGFGFVSPTISIHPANWKSRTADIFLIGGYTLMANGHGSENLVCLGGEINHWRSQNSRIGFLAEFRDHIGPASGFLNPATGAIRIWQIRIGIAIR